MKNNLTTFYKSNLPHLTPIGGTFFVTFRTKDSISQKVMKRLHFKYEEEVKNLSYLSLPTSTANFEARKARHRFFQRFDDQLDEVGKQNYPLADAAIAKIITDKLHELDGTLYTLIAYCIMPNHVHLLISLANQIADEESFLIVNEELALSYRPLHEVMRRIKGATSRLINKELGRTGTPFWQKDSYDHYVRDAKSMENIWWYILNNPVKAKLVGEIEDYPYTWWRNR